ncbi:hypothetical protein B0H10DRAFT_784551 [Mycena sp. CBHHK59/15]|nr:hypothetical protein B0H10DRAFT_784551 [Mycena sp. CBHHK59/15]
MTLVRRRVNQPANIPLPPSSIDLQAASTKPQQHPRFLCTQLVDAVWKSATPPPACMSQKKMKCERLGNRAEACKGTPERNFGLIREETHF